MIPQRPFRVRAGAAALVALVLAGCGDPAPGTEADDGRTPPVGVVEMSDAEMGALGGRIYNEPDAAETFIREAGLEVEEFRSLVREITDDPERSRVYAEAFELATEGTGGS